MMTVLATFVEWMNETPANSNIENGDTLALLLLLAGLVVMVIGLVAYSKGTGRIAVIIEPEIEPPPVQTLGEDARPNGYVPSLMGVLQ